MRALSIILHFFFSIVFVSVCKTLIFNTDNDKKQVVFSPVSY